MRLRLRLWSPLCEMRPRNLSARSLLGPSGRSSHLLSKPVLPFLFATPYCLCFVLDAPCSRPSSPWPSLRTPTHVPTPKATAHPAEPPARFTFLGTPPPLHTHTLTHTHLCQALAPVLGHPARVLKRELFLRGRLGEGSTPVPGACSWAGSERAMP